MCLKQNKNYINSLLISIVYFSILLKSGLLILNGDVYLLLQNTYDILSNNQILYKNIFEINFPTIYIFNIIPYYFYKWFNIEMIYSYVYETIMITYFIFYLILKIIKNTKYESNKYIFILSTILYISGGEIGQREYFIFILMLPYIYARIIYIENKKYNININFLILLASIGILIKPFYAIVIILTELYILLSKKDTFKNVLKISSVFLFIGIIYILLLYIIYPQYFEIIKYFDDYKQLNFQTNYKNFNFLIIAIIIYYLKKENKILEITYLLSFVIVLFLQNKFFTYHFLPSILMIIFIINKNNIKKIYKILLIIYLYKLIWIIMISTYYSTNIKTYIENEIPQNTMIINGITNSTVYIYYLHYHSLYSQSSASILTNADKNFMKTKLYKKNYDIIKKELNRTEYILVDAIFYKEMTKNSDLFKNFKFYKTIKNNYINNILLKKGKKWKTNNI
jgi:hypothetical protein